MFCRFGTSWIYGSGNNITADILTPYFETTKALLAEKGIVATYDPDMAKLFVDGEEYYPEKPHEKRVIEWLHKQIENETLGTMYYNIYPSGYDDRISCDTLGTAIHDYIDKDYIKRDYPKFSYYLESRIEEDLWRYDVLDSSAEDLYTAIKNNLPQYDKTFMRAWDKLSDELDIYEILELGGCEGPKIEYSEYLNRDYFLNIMLATSTEENLDMSSINDFFVYGEEKNINIIKKESDNALTYLIHQQGYTVVDIMKKESADDSEFVKSTKQELDALDYGSNELTMCVSLRGQELLDTLDAMLDRNNVQNLKVAPKTTIGLFNEWNGSCSYLDIKLEKDFIFPNNMVRNIQVDKSSYRDFSNGSKYGYTVQGVCNPVSEVWTDGHISTTDEQPVLVNETFEEMKEVVVPVQNDPDSDDFFNR